MFLIFLNLKILSLDNLEELFCLKHSHHSTSMMAKGELFSIYLKTGKKRLLLTIVSGGLIFLTIVSLVMIVYTHRFQSFQRLNLVLFQEAKPFFPVVVKKKLNRRNAL